MSKSVSSDEASTWLEKEDKKRVSIIRTKFYSLNEKFEQLLKFKPIRKLQLWSVEINLPATYNIFLALKIEDRVHCMSEHVRQLESQLDLKDYYDIKRPTVVFFNQMNKQVRVARYDILSEAYSESMVKSANLQKNINIRECKALCHPSNNSIFLIDGA